MEAGGVDLRALLENQLEGLERWVRAELEGRDKANVVPLRELERRLNEMNELRRQIIAERGIYMTREMYDQKHDELEHLVVQLTAKVSTIEGGNIVKSSTITWALAGLGVVITLVVVFINLATSGNL